MALGAAAASGAKAQVATKDQVIADDLIVQSSLCAGTDCVDNESFGFDTIRIKQPIVRLGFVDTSIGTFPTTDWRMVANDADGEGTGEYFAIENADSAAQIFRLQADAPANSLFIDSVGRVGLRTSTPVLDVHLLTGNTPALRLEQDTSDGNAAQIWDVAGNEANFFVRDVGVGTRLPFRIRPGAPTSSLDIAASGNVGIGTSTPSAPLHVYRNDGSARLRVEEASGTVEARTLLELVNHGPATLRFTDTNADTPGPGWDVTADAGLTLATQGAVTPQFALAANGDLAITGTLSQGSSRLLKTAIDAVDGPGILSRVLELPLYHWSYIGRPATERHIGPMAEDFHALFGLGGDERRLAPSDVAGVALVAVQELAGQVAERERDIGEIRARIEALESRLSDPR